jgi:hypothetical protein
MLSEDFSEEADAEGAGQRETRAERAEEKPRSRNIGIRDLEILRTVARLRYVTSRELRSTFFSCDDFGRKRLKILSGQDLLRPHTRGIPKEHTYSVWRSTLRGVRLLRRAFPDEPLDEQMVARAAANSLHAIQHREDLSRVYLDLLGRGARKDAALMRQRANQITWRADGEVVLRTQSLSRKAIRVIPDAVVTSRVKPRRLFLELDRSTKTLGRIEEDLRAYDAYLGLSYSQAFQDGKSATVVYVVRSTQRQESIRKVAGRSITLSQMPLCVLTSEQACEWLERALVDRSMLVPSKHLDRDEPLASLWTASNALLRAIVTDGSATALDAQVGALRDAVDRARHLVGGDS